jgi:hypothetical protein
MTRQDGFMRDPATGAITGSVSRVPADMLVCTPHEWEYMERQPGETYTGYCERCVKCGEIVQIPQ